MRVLNNSEFKNFKMQGYMRKRVQEVKFFQKNLFPKRYHIIDFTKAQLVIQNKPDSTDASKIKRVPFRDIQAAYLPTPENDKILRRLASGSQYVLAFFVKTSNRVFELYTSTPDERDMWMSGFKYILISTKEVQSIMTNNDEKLIDKIQRQTKKLVTQEVANVRQASQEARS